MTAFPRAGLTDRAGPLLVITDRHQARQPIDVIAEAVALGGGRWLMLRDKDLEHGERLRLAARLGALAKRHAMMFSVSADVELAAAVEAGGVHLQSAAAVGAARARLGNRTVIGVSAHTIGDIRAAAAAAADYVTLSPIFLTPSKPGYGPPLGIAALTASIGLGIPVLALGGITEQTAHACLAAGARGVAVMGEIMRAEDPGGAVAGLLRACRGAAPAG